MRSYNVTAGQTNYSSWSRKYLTDNAITTGNTVAKLCVYAWYSYMSVAMVQARRKDIKSGEAMVT